MLEGLKIGLGITGSFCNFPKVQGLIKKLKEEKVNTIIPIVSQSSKTYDTRFYLRDDFLKMLENETNNKIITDIVEAEPIGPKKMFDALIIAPCSGNTIAKLAHDIIDTPVTMAVKSHLRNNRPVIIGISTNNALSGAAENIGKLLNRKNYYFVPFKQDNPITKPRSIVCDFSYITKTLEHALDNEQISPIIL